MQDLTPLQKMTKARAALIVSQPFFGSLALRLTLEESRTITRTMGTDAIRLVYNPEFVAGLTMPELTGVIGHETMHAALNHVERLKDRDHALFNKAADYAVNPLIAAAGLTLPKSALIDSRYADMSAEQIYALLPQPAPQEKPKDAPKPGAGAGQGDQGQNAPGGPENEPAVDPGGCGGILPAPEGQTPAEAKELADNWKIATVQAANLARAAGNLPASIARMVEELKKPAVDWREVLRRFVATARPSEYSWTPPNRRYVAQGLYLPAMRPDRLSRIAVFVDTSGSIDDATLAMFSAELNAVLDEARPEFCEVTYCDARISSVEEFTPDDYPVKLKAQGGGGTSFRPPFERIEREAIDVDLAVYLTDGESESFPVAPQFPVLWALSPNGRTRPFPFGESLSITPTP